MPTVLNIVMGRGRGFKPQPEIPNNQSTALPGMKMIPVTHFILIYLVGTPCTEKTATSADVTISEGEKSEKEAQEDTDEKVRFDHRKIQHINL